MSVVVRMDMPQSCPCELAGGYDIPLPCFAGHGIPKRCKEFDECVENGTKPDWCPIICQLPEGHGRLVDADELSKYWKCIIALMNSCSGKRGILESVEASTLKSCIEDIGSAKTIVPEEAESQAPKPTDHVPKPTDPVPIRDVYYVMTECDVKTGTVKYEPRERSET